MDKVIARLIAEDAKDLSDFELYRCLSGCVSGVKLIMFAKENRELLTELFLICKQHRDEKRILG